MKPEPGSHLAAAERQQVAAPFLFSEQELPPEVMERVVAREQKFDDWTAGRLFSQRREIYEVVVRMLGAAMPVRLIADLCHVTEKTVVAVRNAEPTAVTAFREALGLRRRNAIARSLDVIAAALDSGGREEIAKAKDAAIVMNILDQQDRLDSGAPTQRLEIAHVPPEDEFRRFLEAHAAHAVEIDAQTGLTRGSPAQRAGDMEPTDPPTTNPPATHD